MQIEEQSQPQSTYRKAHQQTLVDGQAPSLQALLAQAVNNNDTEILKFVFSNRDPEVINATLDATDDERVLVTLVNIISLRLENFPNETSDLLRWLDALLKKKAVFFKENPEALAPIKNRTDFFQVKENLYSSLLRLKGKLAFVLEKNSPQVNGEKFLSSSFGVAKVIVDEREHVDPEEEEDLLALTQPAKKKSKQKSKSRPNKKNLENDSFDDMFDEEAFEEAALGEEDDHVPDPELDAEEDDMLYEEGGDSEDEDPVQKGLDDDEDEEMEFDGYGFEEEEEEPQPKSKGKQSNVSQGKFQSEKSNIKTHQKPKRR